MKKAIKIALTTMVIMCMMLGAMHWFKSHQEEKRLIRQEQERMVEYTLENYEDVRKIEFTSFEQNFSTQTWHVYIIVNDDVYMSYNVSSIGKNERIRTTYHTERSGGKKLKERKNKLKGANIKSIEVIYKKG